MEKSIIAWIIVVLLLAYGSYTLFLARVFNNCWFLLWTSACFIAAAGLVLSKRWSKYFVYTVALFTAGGWIYVTAMIAIKHWPYAGLQNTVIALVPGLLLVMICILFSLFVRQLFMKPTS